MTRPKRLALVLPAFAAVFALAACGTTPSASPSLSTSPSPSPAPSASPPPSPSTTLEPVPDPTSSLLIPNGYGDDMTFGFGDFNGFPIGTTEAEFREGTGLEPSWCSGIGSTSWAPPGSDFRFAGWVLAGPSSDGDNPPLLDSGDDSWLSDPWPIDWFILGAIGDVSFEQPFGPTGPNGLRLGWTSDQVSEAFPDATFVTMIDDRYDFDISSIDEYIIPSPDGTAMVASVNEDGYVNRIAWGSPDFKNGTLFLLCD